MPLKPHPTDPDKVIFVSRKYDWPKREWVGLTDEDIFGIFGTYRGDPDYNHDQLLLDARRIEAKLKDKNHVVSGA